MSKCFTCKKNITKKSPGLECSRCDKVVHAKIECAKISAKQLTALRSINNGLEWSCEDCLRSSPKRSSFFVPDDEFEDADEEPTKSTTDPVTVDAKKLIQDINKEMRKLLREELDGFRESLSFISDQVTNIETTIKEHSVKIKKLENQNINLANKNENLELKISALEQQVTNLNQSLLSSSVEIFGVPKSEDIKLKEPEVIKAIATKLDLNYNEVENIRRLNGSQEKPGAIRLQLRNEKERDLWITASRDSELPLGDLLPSLPRELADLKIVAREALTPEIKTLLWTTRDQLKSSYKYIWFKFGNIRVRKSDKSKVYIIRKTSDIDALIK